MSEWVSEWMSLRAEQVRFFWIFACCMCSEGGDESILLACWSSVNADVVGAYFHCLLLLHIIPTVGMVQSRQWSVGEVKLTIKDFVRPLLRISVLGRGRNSWSLIWLWCVDPSFLMLMRTNVITSCRRWLSRCTPRALCSHEPSPRRYCVSFFVPMLCFCLLASLLPSGLQICRVREFLNVLILMYRGMLERTCYRFDY